MKSDKEKTILRTASSKKDKIRRAQEVIIQEKKMPDMTPKGTEKNSS